MTAAALSATPITIIGGGALGSFLAARLAMAGARVGLVARGRRLEEITRNGVTLSGQAGASRVPVPVSADCKAFPPPRLVIIATKTIDFDAALDLLARVVTPGVGIVTVQNGVEAPEIAARAFPEACVLAARVHGFFELEGAAVRHVGVAPSFAFGPLDGRSCPAAGLFGRWLAAAGIASTRPDDILSSLWGKFLLASAIGGVGLALRRPAGQILRDAEGRQMLDAAMREIALVAAARGIVLPDDCVERTIAFVASFPRDATSSLQRDVEEGRPSEFAALTGAVPRFAWELRIPVPVHDTIIAMIRARGLLRGEKV